MKFLNICRNFKAFWDTCNENLSSSIQFQSGFLLVFEGGWIHLIPSAIALTPSFHLVRFPASSIFNPTFLTLSSTCLLHVSFGRPHFRSSFTSIIIAFFSIISSFLLITCPYHLTPFAFAILSNVFFKPNISISFSIFFLSTSFTPHIASPWLFQFFSKLPFHSLSNTMSHFHTTLLILRNCDKPSLSFSEKTFSLVTTLRSL